MACTRLFALITRLRRITRRSTSQLGSGQRMCWALSKVKLYVFAISMMYHRPWGAGINRRQKDRRTGGSQQAFAASSFYSAAEERLPAYLTLHYWLIPPLSINACNLRSRKTFLLPAAGFLLVVSAVMKLSTYPSLNRITINSRHRIDGIRTLVCLCL